MPAHDLWRAAAPLILASGSATRLKLVTGAGIPCRTVNPDVDERALEAPLVARGASASEIAAHLARAKATAVSALSGQDYVLGGDQTLVVGDRILSKPADRAEAAAHLRLMSGRTHELHAAVAVARGGEIVFEYLEIARLTMRPLSEAFIESYLEVAGPRVQTSVGAYQVEGLGIHLFEAIEGDHSTILGLPLLPLLAWFRAQHLVAD